MCVWRGRGREGTSYPLRGIPAILPCTTTRRAALPLCSSQSGISVPDSGIAVSVWDFNMLTDVVACDCTRGLWGCTDTARESAQKADSERIIPRRTGDSNPHQYCVWLFSCTFYQRSCPRTVVVCRNFGPFSPYIFTRFNAFPLAMIINLLSFYFYFSYYAPTPHPHPSPR